MVHDRHPRDSDSGASSEPSKGIKKEPETTPSGAGTSQKAQPPQKPSQGDAKKGSAKHAEPDPKVVREMENNAGLASPSHSKHPDVQDSQ